MEQNTQEDNGQTKPQPVAPPEPNNDPMESLANPSENNNEPITPPVDPSETNNEPIAPSANLPETVASPPPEVQTLPVIGQPTEQPIADAEMQPAVEQPTVEQITTKPLTNGASVVEPEKKKSKVPILASLVALLVVAVGAIALVAFLPKNLGHDIAQNNQDAPEEIEPITELKLRLTGSGLSDFDLEFLKIEDKEDNVIYSPLSIKYALAMLADGAEGESKTQITNIIGDYQPKAYLNNANRSLANAMFVRDGFADAIKESYASTISTKYNANVIYDSFATPDNVNKWVSDKTLGIIDNMFDETTLNPELSFVLVNALAIDMSWKNQLQCEAGTPGAERVVPCKNSSKTSAYSVKYAHENPEANHYIGPIFDDSEFEKIAFNGIEGAPSAEIGANANRYDIISDLGEDYIRETVQTEYQKWLTENADLPEEDKKFDIGTYMDELKANYGKLNQSTDFYFYNSETEKVFAKDLQTYDGSTLQYVGIMPKAESLNTYVKKLDAEEVSDLIGSLKDAENINSYNDKVVTKVYANIPFFKFNYEINKLSNDLAEIGITDVFSVEDADLSNMINTGDFDGNPFISEAIHKAEIEFSNNGIRAAAATGMGGLGAAGGGFDYEWDIPVEEIDMTFDQPFLFLIRDKDSGEIWFAGSVHNITTTES